MTTTTKKWIMKRFIGCVGLVAIALLTGACGSVVGEGDRCSSSASGILTGGDTCASGLQCISNRCVPDDGVFTCANGMTHDVIIQGSNDDIEFCISCDSGVCTGE